MNADNRQEAPLESKHLRMKLALVGALQQIAET